MCSYTRGDRGTRQRGRTEKRIEANWAIPGLVNRTVVSHHPRNSVRDGRRSRGIPGP
jgi:hypothetical protein